jgi:hypothetical protein
MEQGFMVDRGHHSSANIQSWHAGEPQKSFWLGLRTNRDAQIEIQTYRCSRCGYLESYAP